MIENISNDQDTDQILSSGERRRKRRGKEGRKKEEAKEVGKMRQIRNLIVELI